MGRLGGRARAKNLTPAQRSEIARLGGLKRASIPGEMSRIGKIAAKELSDAEADSGAEIDQVFIITPLPPEKQREIARLGGAARAAIPDEMSRLGRRGGAARAASLSPERRREIALKAVAAREAKRRAARESNMALTPMPLTTENNMV